MAVARMRKGGTHVAGVKAAQRDLRLTNAYQKGRPTAKCYGSDRPIGMSAYFSGRITGTVRLMVCSSEMRVSVEITPAIS